MGWILCVCFFSLASAQDIPLSPAAPAAIEISPNSSPLEEPPPEAGVSVFPIKQKIIFGLDFSNYFYQEELTPPGKSTESAQLVSPFIRFETPVPIPGVSILSVEGKTSGYSTTDYDGTTLTTNIPVSGKSPALFAQGELDFHFELFDTDFSFLSGLGYRYWNRYLSGGSGYREIYSWYYLPLGLQWRRALNEDWIVQFELTYQIMFGGKLLVITSESTSGGDDSSLDLGSRPGTRLQVGVEKKLTSEISVASQLWYEVSKIGQSNEVYIASFSAVIHEPASQTKQSGLALSGIYYF